jgi:hypothetical protein
VKRPGCSTGAMQLFNSFLRISTYRKLSALVVLQAVKHKQLGDTAMPNMDYILVSLFCCT